MGQWIEWVERPPGGAHYWKDIVRELHERPGEWAMVRECESQHVAVNSGGYLRRRYGVQVVIRGKCIYARA